MLQHLRIITALSVLVSAILWSPVQLPASLGKKDASQYRHWSQKFTSSKFTKIARSLYYQIGLNGLTSLNAFETSLIGYLNLKRQGLLKKDDLLVLIDYSKPSDKERFFVIDLNKKRLLYKSLVAHGKNSGDKFAWGFSNRPGSYKSCLGFFVTGQTYKGKHGRSLELQGIEPGINDNALKRRIVIHGADYVSKQFIKRYGRPGRSLGCPALPKHLAKPIIETIKDGSCLFIYGPDKYYFKRSKFINAKGALQYIEKAGI